MATTNNVVIQTNNLSKVYPSHKQDIRALDKLNLTVQAGEIFGYLGPNGAGKTTTIRLLLDLIRPTEGSAAIFGLDAQKHGVNLHQRIGFLPGELSLWKQRSGLQIVKYLASVRGNENSCIQHAHQLAERLKLDLALKVRELSSGNRRKLGLVTAMMHQPDLLILDEPTSGLDPLMQQTFYQLVREARDAGRTVFLSSHVLSEVQAICDRVGILRHGQLKAVETLENLTHAEFRWVTVKLREPAASSLFDNVPGVSQISLNGDKIRLRLTGDFDPLLRALSDQYVVDLHVQEPTLEEIFLAFYGNSEKASER